MYPHPRRAIEQAEAEAGRSRLRGACLLQTRRHLRGVRRDLLHRFLVPRLRMGLTPIRSSVGSMRPRRAYLRLVAGESGFQRGDAGGEFPGTQKRCPRKRESSLKKHASASTFLEVTEPLTVAPAKSP